MPRPRGAHSPGPVRGVRFSAEVDNAVLDFAGESTGGNISDAIRLLVEEVLQKKGGLSGFAQDLEDQGYNAGLRAASHEARVTIAAALNKLWRRK